MKKFTIKGELNIDEVFDTINVEDVRGGCGKVKEIPSYEWDDLDGKMLLLRVIKDNNGEDKKCITLCAYDSFDGSTYVLATKII